MTTGTAMPAAAAASPSASRLILERVKSADRYVVALATLVVLQALWLGILMSRGWYYQADLANLADGHRALSWSYLTAPQGGHLVMPQRAVFWVLNRTMTLNYPATIFLRLIAQAAASVLLARLLTLLVGRRRIVVVAVALYAFSPFLIQGTLWLTASIGGLISQLLLLGALRTHVFYAVTHRLNYALATAGYALAATMTSEQAAVTVLILPILTFAFLSAGSLRTRLATLMRAWPEWLFIGGPILGYVVAYLSLGSYGNAVRRLSFHDAWDVLVREWGQSIAPGLLGGPWRWTVVKDSSFGLATPGAVTQALCGAAVIAFILLCFRIRGWPALAAWSMPLVTSGVGIVIVALGRYHVFGGIIAQQFEHAFYSAVPFALALCLGLCAVNVDHVRARVQGVTTAPSVSARSRRRRATPSRSTRAVVAVAVAAILIGSIASGITYAQHWAHSPARDYITTLDHDLRAAHGRVALYDGPAPVEIIPLEESRFVSNIVSLMPVSANFGYAEQGAMVVNQHGHVVPAAFYRQASVDLTGDQFCRFPVQRSTTTTRWFDRAVSKNDWYVRIGYFQQHSSVLRVTLVDPDGHEHAPVTGSTVLLTSHLARIHLYFRNTAAVAVRVRGTSPATNVCISGADIGFPYPAKEADR